MYFVLKNVNINLSKEYHNNCCATSSTTIRFWNFSASKARSCPPELHFELRRHHPGCWNSNKDEGTFRMNYAPLVSKYKNPPSHSSFQPPQPLSDKLFCKTRIQMTEFYKHHPFPLVEFNPLRLRNAINTDTTIGCIEVRRFSFKGAIF